MYIDIYANKYTYMNAQWQVTHEQDTQEQSKISWYLFKIAARSSSSMSSRRPCTRYRDPPLPVMNLSAAMEVLLSVSVSLAMDVRRGKPPPLLPPPIGSDGSTSRCTCIARDGCAERAPPLPPKPLLGRGRGGYRCIGRGVRIACDVCAERLSHRHVLTED